MNEDDARILVTGGCLSHIVMFIVGFMLAVLLLSSCTTTEYVTMPEKHTEHHWHTDSVIRRDSVYHDRQTTIMQLDSAAMARYGIRLKSAERAWLVQSNELMARLTALEHMTASRDTTRDSIPIPYPVEVKVPAELSWWQQFRLHMGDIALMLLGIIILLAAIKWYRNHG